ncbi:hypothetical protein M9Y10_044471 [Tritrichomonas musculus]|uniref:Cilia- and flagella-associated protein 57 n=1 Tax=Tritrichomonas musculus TaxID=1915356 RepID=A0ABR2JSF5_9EUKA
MASIPSLSYRCVFGISRHAKPNVIFVGSEHIAFPAGNSIVFQNIKDRKQKIYVPPPESFSSGISAIALTSRPQIPSPMNAQAKNQTPYIPKMAIGDNFECPTVCVFDVRNFFSNGVQSMNISASTPSSKRPKASAVSSAQLSMPPTIDELSEDGSSEYYNRKAENKVIVQMNEDFGSEGFVSLSFSGDGNYLLAQGKKPNWSLVIIKLDDDYNQIVTSLKINLTPTSSRRDDERSKKISEVNQDNKESNETDDSKASQKNQKPKKGKDKKDDEKDKNKKNEADKETPIPSLETEKRHISTGPPTITQASFSPSTRHKLIACTGNNVLKVFAVHLDKLVELNIPDPKIGDIKCHLWLTSSILLCADSEGDIFSVLPSESQKGTTENFNFKFSGGVTQGSVLDPAKKKDDHRESPFVAMTRYKISNVSAPVGAPPGAPGLAASSGPIGQLPQMSFIAVSQGGYLTLFESVNNNTTNKKEGNKKEANKKEGKKKDTETRSSLQFVALKVIQLFNDNATPIPIHSVAVCVDQFNFNNYAANFDMDNEMNDGNNNKNNNENAVAVVTLENNRVLAVSLATGNLILNNEEKPVLLPYHDGQILCCSTCIRKPIVATCGADRTVRVWNYLENSLDIIKEYQDPVYCVSLHPDGLSMLIGFGDKLRLCSVFYDDIRFLKEFSIRGCRCCKFSTGGQLFAAVNGSKIQIYSTLTYQLVNTLHKHGATVHDLIWGELDTFIASVGNDGAMFIHRFDNQASDDAGNSYAAPNTTNYSITASPDFSSIFICASDNSTGKQNKGKTSDAPTTNANKKSNSKDNNNEADDKDAPPANNHKIKEIQGGQAIREISFPIPHKQIVMSNGGQMLFSADSSGKVYSYQLAIGGEKLVFSVHEKQISSIAITFNDMFLFTAGDDGVLNVFNIVRESALTSKDQIIFYSPAANQAAASLTSYTYTSASSRSNNEIPTSSSTAKIVTTDNDSTFFPFYSEEVSTTRTDIEEKENQLKNLIQDKMELKGSFKMKKDVIELNHKQEDDKLAEEAKKNKDKNKILLQNKKKSKEDREAEMLIEQQQMRREHENESAKNEEQYSKQIFEVHKVCETLLAEKEAAEKHWREILNKEEKENKKKIDEKEEEHRSELQKHQKLLKQAQDQKEQLLREFEAMKNEINEEKKNIIKQTESKIQQITIDEEDQKTKLEKELGEKEGENKKLQNLYEQQSVDKKRMIEMKEVLQNQLNEINKEIERLAEELDQKISTINDDKKKFEKIKEDREELEKHEKVLAYQRVMIRKQFGPLQQSINDETNQINKMNDDLESAHRISQEMNEKVEDLQNTLKGVIRKEQAQTTKLMNARSYFEQAKNDLHDVVQNYHASEELKTRFSAFYKMYVNFSDDDKNISQFEDLKQSDEDVFLEHQRQKHVLQKQLHQLSRQHLKDEQFQQQAKANLLQHNASLIRELQMLRTVQKKELKKAEIMEKRSKSQNQRLNQPLLLPATEAQRVIEDNKIRISRLEEQLASYSSTGGDDETPFLTEYNTKK